MSWKKAAKGSFSLKGRLQRSKSAGGDKVCLLLISQPNLCTLDYHWEWRTYQFMLISDGKWVLNI